MLYNTNGEWLVIRAMVQDFAFGERSTFYSTSIFHLLCEILYHCTIIHSPFVYWWSLWSRATFYHFIVILLKEIASLPSQWRVLVKLTILCFADPQVTWSVSSKLKPDISDDRRLELQYADPRMLFPCPVLPNANGVGEMNRDRGPPWQFKFSNLFARLLNPLTPHSATQWGEECSGVTMVP